MDIIGVLGNDELNEAIKTLDVEWSMLPGQGLVRVFETNNFNESLNLAIKITQICTTLDHFPQIHLRNEELEVELMTVDAGGITPVDIEIARAIDNLIKC